MTVRALRFVERDGKRILQWAPDASVDGSGNGPVWNWQDVPLEKEEPKETP
jgi:hypothetical protein